MKQSKEPTCVCPKCGYCEHCGRGSSPYYPYPRPYYPWAYPSRPYPYYGNRMTSNVYSTDPILPSYTSSGGSYSTQSLTSNKVI